MINNILLFFQIGQGRELTEDEYNTIKKICMIMGISSMLLLINFG